jgi:hypothetical protein
MQKGNYEQFFYLQRGSQQLLIGSTEKSCACALVTPINPLKADFGVAITNPAPC